VIAAPVVAATPEPESKPAEFPPFTVDPRVEVAAKKLPIQFRRQIVTHYVPILPTFFFARNSWTLPERYVRVGDTASFDELSVSSDAERAHYQSLNIFANRLRHDRTVRVVITGTTSRDEEERANLATLRAQEVADYLVKSWGIEKDRITIRSRIDPALPSNSETEMGREENRRVELAFSSDEIYRPVQLRSVEPITEPASIPFAISAASSLPIDRWKLEIMAGDAMLTSFGGRGAPSDTVAWNLIPAARERVLSSESVGYQLTVTDSHGRNVSSPVKQLPVQLDTTISVRTSADRPDNTAEFLLVTFDFDRADLTHRGRLELNAILDRIGPASKVSIVGYTDPVGELEHNKALALDRARQVASLMPKGTSVEYRGASPNEAPYDFLSPEARFLSRTVRVVVTDPR
jgi:outer membrane protein OmpA-like peptidoglycan-associated protein